MEQCRLGSNSQIRIRRAPAPAASSCPDSAALALRLNANSDGDRRTPTGAGCNTLVDSIWGRWDAIIPPAFPLYFYEYSDGILRG
jgi:hypothetical protein